MRLIKIALHLERNEWRSPIESVLPDASVSLPFNATLVVVGTFMGPTCFDPTSTFLELTLPDEPCPRALAQWLHEKVKGKVRKILVNGVTTDPYPDAIERALNAGAA
jgi:hypothetical protein